MPAIPDPTPSNLSERLELANQLYREYRTRCFWHCPPDLEITEDLIPFVVKGLRTSGGRRGFILASKLLPEASHSPPGSTAAMPAFASRTTSPSSTTSPTVSPPRALGNDITDTLR